MTRAAAPRSGNPVKHVLHGDSDMANPGTAFDACADNNSGTERPDGEVCTMTEGISVVVFRRKKKKLRKVWVICAGDYFGLWVFNYIGWYCWAQKAGIGPFGGQRKCLVVRVAYVQVEIGRRNIQ